MIYAASESSLNSSRENHRLASRGGLGAQVPGIRTETSRNLTKMKTKRKEERRESEFKPQETKSEKKNKAKRASKTQKRKRRNEEKESKSKKEKKSERVDDETEKLSSRLRDETKAKPRVSVHLQMYEESAAAQCKDNCNSCKGAMQ